MLLFVPVADCRHGSFYAAVEGNTTAATKTTATVMGLHSARNETKHWTNHMLPVLVCCAQPDCRWHDELEPLNSLSNSFDD